MYVTVTSDLGSSESIDSKCMRVEAMTEKGEVRFAEECKRLLDLRDEIGTKGNKKHEKREAKARLNHRYSSIHKEEDIIFNGMKDVYKILNSGWLQCCPETILTHLFENA